MAVNTSAGTTIGITAASPASFDAAGFGALNFSVIGEITDLGEFGREYTLVTHSPLASRGVQKRKGSFNAGSITLQMALDNDDAGQVLLKTAANSDNLYSFEVTEQDGTIDYFQASVMSFRKGIGGVDSITSATSTLEINTHSSGVDVVEVLADIDPVPSIEALTLARAADGSVGQTYTATGDGPYQWVARTAQGSVANIAGATGTSYVAAGGDAQKTLGCRNPAGTTYAAGPVLPAPLLIDACDTLDGHVIQNSAGGAVGAVVSGAQVQGSGAIRVTGPATALTPIGVDYTATGTTLDPATADTIAFYFNRESQESVTALQPFIFAGGTNGSLYMSDEPAHRPGGRWVAAHISEFTNGIAAAAPGTARLRQFMVPGAPYNAQGQFDAGMARAKGRPTLILSFDDGYKTIRTMAFPELNARGLKATVYPAPDLLNQGSGEFTFMSTADLQFLDEQGWAIGCNSKSNDQAISTDPATAVAEINAVRAWIEANVGTKASRFGCYTFGNDQSDAVSSAILADGFHMMRGTQMGDFLSRFGFGLSTRKKYPSTGIGLSTDVAAITAFIDKLILRGTTGSIHTHSFTESDANAIFVPAATYTPILDYIAARQDAGELDVLTISELWARDGAASVPA